MKVDELIKAKKYIERVVGTIKHDGHLGTIQTDWILPDLEKALAAIEGSGLLGNLIRTTNNNIINPL